MKELTLKQLRALDIFNDNPGSSPTEIAKRNKFITKASLWHFFRTLQRKGYLSKACKMPKLTAKGKKALR